MQSAFFINMVSLVNGQPKVINLKEALDSYMDFRREVIVRRSQFELRKARDRAHVLEGFRLALNNLERVVKLIRESETADSARASLMTVLSFSQVQAQAVLDMPLRRLAHLEREKITEEYASVVKDISYLEDLLANPRKVLFLEKQDVAELKSKYADPRRTSISEQEVAEFRYEDLIPHQEVVVTLTNQGFIKRVPLSTYRMQRRGGKGVIGMVRRQADLLSHILVVDTHDNLLFFTASGKVYSLKCYEIPEDTSRATKGMALVNLLPIDLKDRVTALVAVANFPLDMFLLMASRTGVIKKSSLGEFASIRRNGLIAIGLKKDDELVSAKVATDWDEIIMASRGGLAVRFKVKNLRTASRTSGGVRGIRLSDDCVIGMDVVFPEAYLLTVTENGFGKLTAIKNYPIQGRGGKGVRAHKVIDKTGKIAAFKLVGGPTPSGYLAMLSAKGNVECIPMEQISIQRRNSRGVRLMTLADFDSVVSIATLES
jgi:DNA gyrase subunit A